MQACNKNFGGLSLISPKTNNDIIIVVGAYVNIPSRLKNLKKKNIFPLKTKQYTLTYGRTGTDHGLDPVPLNT